MSVGFCEICGGNRRDIEGFDVCSACGIQVGRLLGQNLGFDQWRDYSSVYTRKYRFHNLLKDLNGNAKMPETCIKHIWDNRKKIKKCTDAKEMLRGNKIFRKYQNQVATVMNICSKKIPFLDQTEISRGCLLFTMIDMEIGKKNSIKVAFTYILPVILRLIGRLEWETQGFLKNISQLLLKKYKKCTDEAIKTLNLSPQR